jgi:hypothetical protein
VLPTRPDLPSSLPTVGARRHAAPTAGGVAAALRERGELDLSAGFIDGTFVVAKQGALAWERPSGARVRSARRWQTALVVLSPPTWRLLHGMKVTLVPETLAATFSTELPERLIGDKAYDSDPTDGQLAKVGIELIAPQWANRKKSATQDGRPLRRYRCRWQSSVYWRRRHERFWSWRGACDQRIISICSPIPGSNPWSGIGSHSPYPTLAGDNSDVRTIYLPIDRNLQWAIRD